jgi:hypothetical protein
MKTETNDKQKDKQKDRRKEFTYDNKAILNKNRRVKNDVNK